MSLYFSNSLSVVFTSYTFPKPLLSLFHNLCTDISTSPQPMLPQPQNRRRGHRPTDVGDIGSSTSGTSVERLWRRDKTRRGDAPVGAPPLQSWCQVWSYLISMCRVSLAFSSSVFFGMLMVKTPSAMPAVIFDFSTFSGSENLCSNLL